MLRIAPAFIALLVVLVLFLVGAYVVHDVSQGLIVMF